MLLFLPTRLFAAEANWRIPKRKKLGRQTIRSISSRRDIGLGSTSNFTGLKCLELEFKFF